MLTTGGLASDTVSLMLIGDSRSSGFCYIAFALLLPMSLWSLVRAESLLLRLVLSIPFPPLPFFQLPPFSSCQVTFLFVFFGQDQK